ncbi:MAG: NO-inducible flavohemoprotein [Thiomicrospira sp.]|uniref:NO-inducible flavohemoprotein n=1 Tax=Thiomicrospira sp. TaxID=935 RepID=UPI0019DFE762|nr:NO-inducible flavohemoprotein [Thiomicrospira sp.]MBE0493525.1 NO-inducible flavohemoprotein [Thiomicrospira sp.]
MLTPQIIETVKSTAPILAEQGVDITHLFYKKLFNHHPELKHVFNMANQAQGEQSKALAESVFMYASRIDELEALGPMVKRIAHKHASLHIQPDHYPIVGKYLLEAIQEHLSLPDDHEVLKAWAVAYGFLAQVFVDTEEQIYAANEQKTGGWRGFKAFNISRIVNEGGAVKSFYLIPEDGELVEFEAGQYLGIKLKGGKAEFDEIRQYSISNAPGEPYYRISVKTEAHSPDHPGQVSNRLHQAQVGDQVWVQPPTGDFIVKNQINAKIFIAAGVGITPLLSMLHDQLNKDPKQNLCFIQCVRDASHHIMKNEISLLKHKYGFEYFSAYQFGEGADHQGYLNADILKKWLSNTQADVYFCGPKPFMAAIHDACTELGFKPEQLHYEVFGPTTSLK